MRTAAQLAKPDAIAVDPIPLLPGGDNGGIEPLAIELVRRLGFGFGMQPRACQHPAEAGAAFPHLVRRLAAGACEQGGRSGPGELLAKAPRKNNFHRLPAVAQALSLPGYPFGARHSPGTSAQVVETPWRRHSCLLGRDSSRPWFPASETLPAGTAPRSCRRWLPQAARASSRNSTRQAKSLRHGGGSVKRRVYSCAVPKPDAKALAGFAEKIR